MNEEYKLKEMVNGYWSGRYSENLAYPDCHKHMSAGFKHGWLNERDDRIGKPRDKAAVLRRRADMCLTPANP